MIHSIFGFSKFDVMFGHKTSEAIKIYYRNIVKPGVTFKQETIVEIDPVAKKVTTSQGVYEADVLVIALGADYDIAATPALQRAGMNFILWPAPTGCGKYCPLFQRVMLLLE